MFRVARSRWACVLTLIFGILSLAASLATADSPVRSPDAAKPVSFDIPAQPLAAALQAFAQVTGQSVFFDGQLAAGLESVAVRGEFAPRDALQRLLSGTRLAARYADETTFTLVEAEAPPQPAAAPSAASQAAAARDDGNARIVQQALERTLCRWPRAQPGGYRALVQLWVGPAGHVRRTRLLTSTGAPQRDAALESAMNTLVLTPPADGGAADEPLTILLLPRTEGSTDVCAGVAPAASP